jgi:hypothetical protein
LSLEQLEMRALLTSGFPHVNLAGTTGDDVLVLDTDPLDSSMLRVWSTTGTLPSVSFPKSGLISLTIDGGGGTDSITVAADVPIGGGAVQLLAETITIGAGASIVGASQVSLTAVTQENSVVAVAVSELQARVLVAGNITTTGSLRIEARVEHSAVLAGVGSSLSSTSSAVAEIADGAVVSAGTVQILARTDADITADASGSLLGSITVTADHQTHAGIRGGAAVFAGGGPISGVEPSSVLIQALDSTNIKTTGNSTASDTFDFSALTSSITLKRDTRAFVLDSPSAGATLATFGLASILAENRGTVSGTITSDLIGSVEHDTVEDSLAYIQDAAVSAAGVVLDASSSTSYVASAKTAVNSV